MGILEASQEVDREILGQVGQGLVNLEMYLAITLGPHRVLTQERLIQERDSRIPPEAV